MPEQAGKPKEKRRAFEALIHALKDEDITVRSAAVKTLGLIGDERAVNSLINILKHRNPKLLANAAEALGRIGDRRAVRPLIRALAYMPIDATLALGALRDQQAMAPIIDNIQHAPEDWQYCEIAVKALEQIDPFFIDKNAKLVRHFSDLFCNQCWRRPLKFDVMRRSSFSDFQIVVCAECKLPTHLDAGITHVAGEIGGIGDTAHKEDTTLWIPIWNENQKIARYADIDSLWIRSEGVHNYHLAANAVILALTAPADKSPARLKNIPVHTDPGLLLPNPVVNMIKDVFRWNQK